MENLKVPVKTYEQKLKCIRWGVCSNRISDIFGISVKSVCDEYKSRKCIAREEVQMNSGNTGRKSTYENTKR